MKPEKKPQRSTEARPRPPRDDGGPLGEYERAMRAKRLLGCSIATFYRIVERDPSFPKPIRLSTGLVLWKMAEIRAYLDAKRGASARKSAGASREPTR